MKTKVSLYRRIAATLAAEIEGGRYPDGWLPGENVLALRFRVNPRTVREALAMLVKSRLIERRQGIGTAIVNSRPARRMAILTNLERTSPRASPFFQRVMHYLSDFLDAQGYAAEFYLGRMPPGQTTGLKCDNLLEDIAEGKVQGVVVISAELGKYTLEELHRSGIPLVGTSRDFRFGVQTNMTALLRAGMDMLLQNNRKRIAFMGWSGHRATQMQRNFVAEELRRAGLPLHDGWVRDSIHPTLPAAGWEEFREIWTARPDKPDGLLISDDLLFRDAVPAILSTGARIPEDLMVVTHANRDSGIAYPFPVTRLEYDPETFAIELGRMLIHRTRGEAVKLPRVVIPFTCVTSVTTGNRARQLKS